MDYNLTNSIINVIKEDLYNYKPLPYVKSIKINDKDIPILFILVVAIQYDLFDLILAEFKEVPNGVNYFITHIDEMETFLPSSKENTMGQSISLKGMYIIMNSLIKDSNMDYLLSYYKTNTKNTPIFNGWLKDVINNQV